MKAKTIFRTLAAAMLMPAMLLTASCSSEDNLVNNENTGTAAKQGYTLPVTVNVTRQGDNAATRATYDDGTKTLAFSTGDKLFVKGYDDIGAGDFAGTLSYVSGGTFSGTISTKNEYTGTADDLFSKADDIEATLLPNGYGTYGFLSIEAEHGYDAYYRLDYTKAIALTKAAAVEQFSLEQADEYDDGFALTPQNAILNFTIAGLTASTDVTVEFKYASTTVSKTVTTDTSGNATFAIGMSSGRDLNTCSLTVGGNDITLVSESKTFSAGKIYNITRCIYPIDLNQVKSAAYLGSVVATDGKVYAKKADVPSGQTAVAMIAYVGDGEGLAIALADETQSNWNTAKSNCEGKTAVGSYSWSLPSQVQMKAMFKAFGNNENSYAGLNNALATAGGNKLKDYTDSYWLSDESGNNGYRVTLEEYSASWSTSGKGNSLNVRACLAF